MARWAATSGMVPTHMGEATQRVKENENKYQ